jgi:hypothetical protein
MIEAVQIMAVLYLLFAIRMRVWRVSINTFIVILAFSIITLSREFEVLRNVWVNYHLSIIAIIMTVLITRVVYQIATKKKCDKICYKERI